MKRIVSALLAVLLLFSFFSFSAFADSTHSLFCPRCNTFQLQGVVTEHAYCPKCGGLLLEFGGGDGRGSGAGRRPGAASIEVPKQYYTSPSAGGSGTSYNGGTTSYYSVMNTQNNTLNFTTYNKTTNNYTQNNYTYNNYTYNNEYNYYTYNIENHNYYVTNNYTYVTVVYPDGTKDENGNDNYESVDIYYKLPDGRNSYDLTADEIYGTYLTYNVTGAEKVAEDDGTTLGLWHLDRDYTDSSYHAGKIKPFWGSSIFESSENLNNAEFGQCLLFNSDTYTTTFSVPLSKLLGNTLEFKVYFPDPDSTFFSFSESAIDSSFVGWSGVDKSDPNFNGNVRTKINISAGVHTLAFQFAESINAGDIFSSSNLLFNVYLDGALANSAILGTNDKYSNVNMSNKPVLSYFSDGLKLKYSNHFAVGFVNDVQYLDEVRISKGHLYGDYYTPSLQPFDTNSVLIRPENPAENDIVVMSNIPVADYRIGGVRPTYPVTGSTFIYLENDVVQSIQQYQGDGWVSVDAFIWQDGEWKNLLKYNFADLKFEEPDEPAPSPSPSPDPGGCTHEYVVDSEKAPTCTVKGSTTYKCKLCGDSYTEDIPALGHDWQIVGTGGGTVVSPSPSPDSSSSVASSGSESTSEPTSSEPPAPTQPPATEPEYTLYRCSRCGMEYKDYEGSGPPSGGDEDEEEGGILGMLKKLLGTIVNGIVSILETVLGGVIKLLVSLIDELVSGLTAVIDGLISSMGQIANFGGTFKDFLGQVFPFIPSEIVMLLGFSLSLSIILMIIKFFRG